MKTYSVVWQIDVDAESPLEAAKMAREIQLRPDSSTVVFDVTEGEGDVMFTGERVDLMEEPEAQP